MGSYCFSLLSLVVYLAYFRPDNLLADAIPRGQLDLFLSPALSSRPASAVAVALRRGYLAAARVVPSFA